MDIVKYKSIDEAFESITDDDDVDLYSQKVVAHNREMWPTWTLEQKLDLCEKVLEKIESSNASGENKTLDNLDVYEYRGKLLESEDDFELFNRLVLIHNLYCEYREETIGYKRKLMSDESFEKGLQKLQEL